MTAAVSLSGVVRSVDGAEILHGIDLEVGVGEIVGLLGPNGAGKSTTVDLVVGLAVASAGRVRVLGVDPAADRRTITAGVGVQPQSAALFPTLTVDETLALFASFYDDPLPLAEIRERVGLDGVRATRVRHLSGGEERRLLIALALIGRPELVVLDEPSAGLDAAIRRDIAAHIREIRAAGATVLMTTHHLDEAQELCDRVAIMSRGRVVLHGAPEELARELSGESELEFTVPSGTDVTLLDAAVGDERAVRRVPGGDRITVRSGDPDTVLRRITFTRGLRATGVSVRQPSLEDVYLAAVAGEDPLAADA